MLSIRDATSGMLLVLAEHRASDRHGALLGDGSVRGGFFSSSACTCSISGCRLTWAWHFPSQVLLASRGCLQVLIIEPLAQRTYLGSKPNKAALSPKLLGFLASPPFADQQSPSQTSNCFDKLRATSSIGTAFPDHEHQACNYMLEAGVFETASSSHEHTRLLNPREFDTMYLPTARVPVFTRAICSSTSTSHFLPL